MINPVSVGFDPARKPLLFCGIYCGRPEAGRPQ
jgi:hypothetical protein